MLLETPESFGNSPRDIPRIDPILLQLLVNLTSSYSIFGAEDIYLGQARKNSM
jgi:hypothetical protein